MFDISKDQLLRLSDVDLRELVARLCEAELSRAGAPVSAVRWGGSQTAPDGGLDVEILVKDQEFAGDFVPRAWTGIQVKKSSMPAGKIADEMSPKGVLRPIFPELATQNGCYIIVSLADDPAGTNLGNREQAMQTQVESVKGQGDLRVEFYGRSQLANWLRQYPGVQRWVREANVTDALASPTFKTMNEVAAYIKRLLIENRATWKTYGPESEEAAVNPFSSIAQLWTARKLDTIIPNNTRIINAITRNKSLFDSKAYEAARAFVEHAKGFERNCYKRSEGIPRFPQQFDRMVTFYAEE